MNKDISHKITEKQYRAIVESSMIALGVLALPRGVSKYAYQEGWVAVVIGGIYPIIVVLLAAFIDKKMGGMRFEEVNNKIYGKFLSKIILVIFSMIFIFYWASIITGFSNVLHLVLVSFISPYVMIIIVVLLTLYASINGLTLIARFCEMIFYLIISFVIVMAAFLFRGNIANLMPFFSSFGNILSAVPESLYSYTGVELSYIVISFITNKRKPKKAGLYAVLLVMFLYTLSVTITTYSLGWEISSKNSYPTLYLASTVLIPLIENFRTTVMVVWSFVIFRILNCDIFGASYCLSKAFNINYKGGLVIALALSVFISLFMVPEYKRADIVGKFTPYAVLIGVLWGIITSIIIVYKEKHIGG